MVVECVDFNWHLMEMFAYQVQEQILRTMQSKHPWTWQEILNVEDFYEGLSVSE